MLHNFNHIQFTISVLFYHPFELAQHPARTELTHKLIRLLPLLQIAHI